MLMVGCILISCSSIFKKNLTNPEIQLISADIIQKHLTFLASDSMKGRNTPSRELDSAASYIAQQFSNSGLEPLNGSYLQYFNLCIVELSNDAYFSLTTENTVAH